jgi:amino acid adenylation domain-containing protein
MRELLKRLKHENIIISLHDNDLKLKFNGDKLPADLMQELKANKNAIIKYLESINEQGAAAVIPVLEPRESYMASSSQLRVWTLCQFEEGNIAYKMRGIYMFTGALNTSVLEWSFQQLISRHEVLRTVFVFDAGYGEVRQKVLDIDDSGFELEQTDVRGDDEALTTLDDRIEKDILQPFDLAEGPLLRACIYHIDDNRSIFLYVMHHIISDGWSMQVMINELLLIYNARINGLDHGLQPLRIQYRDYSAWQRNRLNGVNGREEERYWLSQFSGRLPQLNLPLDHPYPSIRSYRGGTVNFFADKALTDNLRCTLMPEGCTLFMGLLAVTDILLYRYTGQTDIIIGSPVAGRGDAELESQIGFYLNTIALRTRFDGKDSFLSLLSGVKQLTLDGFQFQGYPLDELVDKLSLRRDPRRNVLFDVMILLQNFNAIDNKQASEGLKGLEISLYKGREDVVSKYDLTFYFTELEGGVSVDIEYNSDIFNRAAIISMADYFQTLTAVITVSPELAIDELIALSLKDDVQQVPFMPGLGESVPCSEHQKRLWFINEFEKDYLYQGSPVYHNLPLLLKQHIPLDEKQLNCSIEAAITSNSVLRTSILSDLNEPSQLLRNASFRGVLTENLSVSSENEVVTAVMTLVKQPFDITNEPLIKFYLLNTKDGQQYFLIIAHHLTADRRSMLRLAKMINDHYQSGAMLHEPPDGNLLFQYTDFTTWENTLLSGKLPAADFFWMNKLKAAPVLNLETDSHREHIHVYDGSLCSALLPGQLSSLITAFCSKLQLDPGIFLLSCFKILLYRYTGTEDIVIGTFANRDIYARGPLLGPLSNLIALRSHFSSATIFGQFFEQVKKDFLQSQQFGYMPFEKVVQLLNPDKDMSRTALFDILFQYEAAETAGSLHPMAVIELNYGLGKYDLNLLVKETANGGFGVYLTYNRLYFNEKRMEELLQHYMGVIRAVIEQPEVPLCLLDYLTTDEKNHLLYGCNDMAAAYPTDVTLVSLFEEQVERTPENTALIFEDRQITYSVLNEFSNRLADYLRRQHYIQPNDLVVVELERNWQMVAVLLGILKAGAAYVPIDPSYPGERISHMRTDSGCKVVIDKLLLEDFEQQSEKFNPFNPARVNSQEDLAYVIYTSGTTGMPKGSLISHKNVVRLFFNDHALFDFGPSDVWTMFHSYCFDFSVWEMYGALLFGGRLVIVPFSTAQNPELYWNLLVNQKVTVLNQTPSSFYNVSSHGLSSGKRATAIRYVIFGGEALSPVRLQVWYGEYPMVKLINMYGITETTVHVTCKVLTEADIVNNIAGVGHAIPTLSCYVMDQYQQLLPFGLPGELYVGGAGVCRGYLNRPELTAERFITHPLLNGKRLYRTGDKVKQMESGELVYLGRIDEQVKVRGYRIELGEIVAVLQRHADVEAAAVVLCDITEGEQELVAYITARNTLNSSNVRLWLAEHLPSYMIPGYYVQLNHMPLTSNGKIDKRAFPHPLEAGLQDSTAYIPPRTDTERRLAGIWQLVLGKHQIGLNDNFFDLGGHSLKATRLASHIHKEFGIQVALKDLFTNVLLEDQALLIDRSGTATAAFAVIPTAPAVSHYPLSSSQRRLWMLSQLEEISTVYHMPGTFEFSGRLDAEALRYSFKELIRRHEILRTVFVEDEAGVIRQAVLEFNDRDASPGYTDLSSSDASAVLPGLLENFLSAQFDLTRGPLFKGHLYKLSACRHIFSYVMHHIVSDGWSMGILIRELLGFYNTYINAAPPLLNHLRIQYKDYAVWQQARLHDGSFEPAQQYWLKQLGGSLPVLDLPADMSWPSVKTYNGGVVQGIADSNQIMAFTELCQSAGCTLFMGLVSLVNTLLYRYTGQEDIILGTPSAGRSHADLDDQVGFYINTLCLRSRFSGAFNFIELLAHVRGVTLDAYQHQQYPFDELVEELVLKRDISRSTLFDVMIVLQNTDSSASAITEAGIKDVTVSAYSSGEHRLSKFALTFTFSEAEEGLAVNIEYNSDIFYNSTAQRMLEHFNGLLTAVLSLPMIPLDQLCYISEEETHSLVHLFNDTVLSYPGHTGVLQMFEQQAAAIPDDVALMHGDTMLTYGELNRAANRLSRFIQSVYHIKAGDVVGVKIDRSEWLIISILGILKAGCTYVPLDTAYPSERLEYMVADSNCALVIDTAVITNFTAAAEDYEPEDMHIQTQPHAIAYIIYTSGSTGKPKGCMITHDNLTNYINWANGFYFNESAVGNFGLFTSVSFDLTVTSIFCTLTRGKTLFIYRQQEEVTDILAHYFTAENGPDTVKLTPSHINLLKQYNIRSSSVACAIVGGEEVTTAHIEILTQINPDMRVYNEYGPTEGTVGCIVKELKPGQPLLIGKPVSNMAAYILSESKMLCSTGVVGEIYISGKSISPGYLGKPDLTAEKFLPDPFIPGRRMYRTGDMGRWLAGGDIEYRGRKDNQVKIRGYRIETGEIEDELRLYKGVDAVSVQVRLNDDGEKELVAYIAGNEKFNTAALRSFLGVRLPFYMIPGHYIQLEVIPLTPNGKVDAAALMRENTTEIVTGIDYVEAGTSTEKMLLGIWQKILHKDRVGINDNFFDLGGNSFTLIKMVNAVNQQTGKKIKAVNAFRYPDINRLAAFIEAAGDEQEKRIEAETEMQASASLMEDTLKLINFSVDEK